LSEAAKLVYLQEKLNGIRRTKRTTIVTTYIASFFLAFLWNFYLEFDFTIGLVIWIIVGTGIGITIDKYYEVKKARIMQQIKQLSFKTIVGAEKPAPPASSSQEPIVLAICPQCKNRIPSKSKFCPECGTDLRPNKTT